MFDLSSEPKLDPDWNQFKPNQFYKGRGFAVNYNHVRLILPVFLCCCMCLVFRLKLLSLIIEFNSL